MRSLVGFFAATFLISWAAWFAAARLTGGAFSLLAPGGVLGTLLLYAGIFAPALVAIALTQRARGGAGVRALLARLFRWQVPWPWYLFALGYMIALKLAGALAQRIALGGWPRFGTTPVALLLGAAVFSTLIGGQAGEEIGWRGFALPRLGERIGMGAASVVLGLLWALWHLPLFYWFPQADTFGQSFPLFTLQVVAYSVAIAWLYLETGGSLLLTMLMHAALNNTKDIVPPVPRPPANPLLPGASPTQWITLALLWIAAGYFLVRMARTRRPA